MNDVSRTLTENKETVIVHSNITLTGNNLETQYIQNESILKEPTIDENIKSNNCIEDSSKLCRSNCNTPIAEVSTNHEPRNHKISDYLLPAKTPQRQGKKQSERVSFVLTSTAYKKKIEDKELTKQEMEKKKEDNKLKKY